MKLIPATVAFALALGGTASAHHTEAHVDSIRQLAAEDCTRISNGLQFSFCSAHLQGIAPQIRVTTEMSSQMMSGFEIGFLWGQQQACVAMEKNWEAVNAWEIATRKSITQPDWPAVLETITLPTSVKDDLRAAVTNEADCLDAMGTIFSDAQKYPALSQEHRNIPRLYHGAAEVLRGLDLF